MIKKLLFTILFFHFACTSSLFASNGKKENTTRPKIGLVLSGGGAKGISHIGTLKMLEDLGIPIDYISGTSMGAIIGGLYAMGYSASELDSIIRNANWSFLLSDTPLRSNLGIGEKIQDGSYQLNLRFGGKGISLMPSGAIEGQHIDNLFSLLTLNSYTTKDFSDLSIPFFCVGTDIATGEGIILDSGNLAKSMRASMAVPTVFTPVEINGHLLVDGGLVNNFPVEETRVRGADIIIGVDVGYQYLEGKNIRSFMNILEQTLFLNSMDKNAASIAACNIYIQPELDNYTSYNFNAVDSLLEIGYRAAEKAYPDLKALADKLKTEYDIEPNPHSITPIQSIYIDSIIYIGSNKYSHDFINQYLQITSNKNLKITDLEKGIQRLYGSTVYSKVTYFLSPSPKNSSHVLLNLELMEAPINKLKLGIRYDNIRGPALLAGATFRNLGLRNSQLNINLELSAIPVADVSYTYTPSWTREANNFSYWRPSIGVNYIFYNLHAYTYSSGENTHQKTSEYLSIGQKATLFAQFNVKNNMLGLGLTLDYTHTNQSVGIGEFSENSFFLYPVLFYVFDNYNSKYYPSKGCRMRGNIKYFDNLRTNNSDYENHFANIFFQAEFAIKLVNKLILYPGFMIGGTFFNTGAKIPSQQYIVQGGLIPFSILNSSSFIGLKFMQSGGLFGINGKVNLQYEVFKNTYVTARFAIGKTDNKLKEITDLSDLILGGGVSISYATPVGPLGVTFQGSNYHPFGVFFNFGYWF